MRTYEERVKEKKNNRNRYLNIKRDIEIKRKE